MVLDDLPDDNLAQEAIKRFRELRQTVFGIMPKECFLKFAGLLTGPMVMCLDKDMVRDKLISSEDVCSLCSVTECPASIVKDRTERIARMGILQLTRKLKPQ